ncbi:MAG: NifB/NifX family molybdenum-iron cluster-binding protein [Armatimonadota bacterium]|nr:MAG: NifB/NifX family molybdenum-iron cluster-binding protein [Armatimonadota bacterium]
MRVAISTDGDQVAPHFGRCEAYTLVDLKEGEIAKQERIPNPGHEPGFLPGYLAECGVNCIVAGGMGPRAKMLFDEKQIEAIVGVSCSVREAIEGLLQGALTGGASLCDYQPK